MQLALLAVEEGAERLLELLSYHRDDNEPLERGLDQGLVKGDDDEQLLNVHLDDSLADQGGTEERPEGDQKVAACDAGEVEQRVWDLKKSRVLFYTVWIIRPKIQTLQIATKGGQRRKEHLRKIRRWSRKIRTHLQKCYGQHSVENKLCKHC